MAHKRSQVLLVPLIVCWACLWPALASADFEGFTWGHGSVAGGLRFASDNLDVGVGANGGYTLEQGVYLGGTFAYYFGDDDTVSTAFASVSGGVDAWFLMAEGGYDFGVTDALVLRPTAAIGVVTATWDGCVSGLGVDQCEDESDSDMAGAIGGHILYDLSGLTLGGELRLIIGDRFDGAWLGLNVGAVF